MRPQPIHLPVPEDDVGERLDRFLTRQMEGTTRSVLRRWISEGRVLLNDRPAAKPGVLLRSGDELLVQAPDPDPDRPTAESIPIEILYEDDHLVVVFKPAGLVVHPGHGCPSGTLVNALLGAGIPLAAAGGVQRPGIVHRLDRETSGLMVAAKSDTAHRSLAEAFAQRTVHKGYTALVWGTLRPESGRIERAIGRSRNNPTRMAVEGTRGRRRTAITDYRTMESIPGFSLLEIDLLTGRTHQIRVHMQAIRHPIVGDERYGGCAWKGVQDPVRRKALREFEGLALHAGRLRFAHPTTGRRMVFHAPLPERFETLLTTLRVDG